MERTDDIILKREARGIRVSLIGKTLFLVGNLMTLPFVTQNRSEIFVTDAILVPIIVIQVYALFYMRKQRKKGTIRAIGICSTAIDVLITCILPFVWYKAVGWDAVPRTYILKTYLPPIVFGILILEALSLSPLYPALYAGCVSVFYMALYFWAAQDPRFTTTGDYIHSYLGDAVQINMYFMNILLTAAAGYGLFVTARTARKMIVTAAKNEVRASQLSRYFSPNIADKIAETADDAIGAGRMQNAAVLFCDIRGFTSLSEQNTPERIIDLLKLYHETMVRVIFNNGGTLDKFIGDGILATFGTPSPGGRDELNAVKAGVEMRAALSGLNEQLAAAALPAIHIGIGIHSGPVIAGNIGVENRLEYTVIGNTVNMASRIEGLCKTIGRNLLISSELADKVRGTFRLVSAGMHQVRGKEKLIEVFAVEE